MNLKKLRKQIWVEQSLIVGLLLVFGLIGSLLVYRLGSLPSGLSQQEVQIANHAVGWHGIYNQFFNLPINLVRSVVFFFFPDHGQLLSRVPNVIFGALTVVSFACLVRIWHGTRTAVLATLLFGCSAWLLHASRLASFDVLYLWTIPTLLLSQILLKKYPENPWVWYGSLLAWGLLLYVPGVIWLLLLGGWVQRKAIMSGWQHFSDLKQRSFTLIAALVWVPLLLLQLTRPGSFITWLGLPEHLASGMELMKQFAAVPVHLFIRGPQYPEIWLGKVPILDIFSLVACVLGIYFYARHWQASRSHILAFLMLIGGALVALGGPVPLSLLVPLLYLAAATGIAYLTHEWLRVFPLNPVARSVGIGLVAVAVALSCVYNTRAYFVAWANNDTTRASFHYRQ